MKRHKGSTHYMGCECHEKAWAEKVKAARALALEEAAKVVLNSGTTARWRVAEDIRDLAKKARP